MDSENVSFLFFFLSRSRVLSATLLRSVSSLTRVVSSFPETLSWCRRSYPSLAPVFRESDLENGLWQFARELKYFGVNLETVICGFLRVTVICGHSCGLRVLLDNG